MFKGGRIPRDGLTGRESHSWRPSSGYEHAQIGRYDPATLRRLHHQRAADRRRPSLDRPWGLYTSFRARRSSQRLRLRVVQDMLHRGRPAGHRQPDGSLRGRRTPRGPWTDGGGRRRGKPAALSCALFRPALCRGAGLPGGRRRGLQHPRPREPRGERVRGRPVGSWRVGGREKVLGRPSRRIDMASVQKITLSASRDIPFNKLVLSQSNVRRVKAGVSIEELADDIARRTLLQSLSVRPVLDADGAETGMFEVPAGGRRYRALELLVKQKRMAKTAPVPCVVRDPSTAILAEDDSLAENVQRVPLHPLDLFRAFRDMRQKGM